MKSPLFISNIKADNSVTYLLNRLYSAANTIKLAFAVLTLSLTTISVAATSNDDAAKDLSTSSSAYVDSIHQWGAWELDIEPAAGGLTPQTTQPLNARSAKITIRTNSISALAPAAPATITPISPISVPPVIPVTPPPPPVTPPIGGPADGLF